MAHEHMERGGFSCSFAATTPKAGACLGAAPDPRPWPVPTGWAQAGSPQAAVVKRRFTVSQVHGTCALNRCENTAKMPFSPPWPFP